MRPWRLVQGGTATWQEGRAIQMGCLHTTAPKGESSCLLCLLSDPILAHWLHLLCRYYCVLLCPYIKSGSWIYPLWRLSSREEWGNRTSELSAAALLAHSTFLAILTLRYCPKISCFREHPDCKVFFMKLNCPLCFPFASFFFLELIKWCISKRLQ